MLLATLHGPVRLILPPHLTMSSILHCLPPKYFLMLLAKLHRPVSLVLPSHLTMSSTKTFPHHSSGFLFVFVVVVKLRIRLQGTVVKLNHLLKIQSDWFLQNVQHRLSPNDIVEAQRAPQTLMPRGHFSGTLYWM